MKFRFTILLIAFFVLGTATYSIAQQDPQFSQFMYNKLTYNSAFAGSSDKICATLLHRNQWMSFGGGETQVGVPMGVSPITSVAGIHAPIKMFGIGLNIVQDELGFEKTLSPTLSLVYKYELPNQAVLATGVGLGFVQKTLTGDKLKPQDPNDPKIPPQSVDGTENDFNFGLYYTMPQLYLFDNFYAGISATHLTEPTVRYEWPSGSTQTTSKRHYYITTGAEYILSSEITLNPNILIKTDLAKFQTDLNCYAIWNQNIRGGLSWRPLSAISVLLGYEFPFGLNIGYSYDLTTNKILKYTSGTHEIMARYCFTIKIQERQKIFIPRLTPRFL